MLPGGKLLPLHIPALVGLDPNTKVQYEPVSDTEYLMVVRFSAIERQHCCGVTPTMSQCTGQHDYVEGSVEVR